MCACVYGKLTGFFSLQIDDFKHPKTNKRSLCYRINYRSMDRNVTNEEINEIQEKVRSAVKDEFNVELR